MVRADAADFTQALAKGDDAPALDLYRGPFLDGFSLNDAPEFERWVETERDRFARANARALEALAEDAAARKDFVAAAEWWMARAAQDPYDSRVALRLVLALEAGGNRAGALHQASLHQRLLEQDLGIDSPPELREAVEAIRSRRQDPTSGETWRWSWTRSTGRRSRASVEFTSKPAEVSACRTDPSARGSAGQRACGVQ